MADMPPLSLRDLNRTFLHRQFLLERTGRSPYEVIAHLVAMQGQEPNWPYVGLWSRIEGFRREDLEALLRERRIVRSTMVRRTMHLAAADDFRWLRPTARGVVRSALTSAYFAREIEGLDPDEVGAAGRALLAAGPLTRKELGLRLAERFPGRLPARLADTVEVVEPLVHTPEVGAWGGWGNRSGIGVTLPDAPMAGPDPDRMVRRYLAAFGPATVMDAQAWSGVTRLRTVFDRLRPHLRVLEDERGRELFDLPDAPLLDGDAPAPVRFLPAFDNALLGHRDRTRIIRDEHRGRFARVASGGVPMFLVDGFVRGVWSVRGTTLAVTPLDPLPGGDAAAVRAEAERLLPFLGGAEVVVTEGDQ